jgi:hypothetical protein
MAVNCYSAAKLGIVGDWEVDPSTGSTYGSDQTDAIIAACATIKDQGGGVLWFEHPGRSRFNHYYDSSVRLDKGYLVDEGNIAVPHGVILMSAFGRDAGDQSVDVAGGWGTPVAWEIPSSSMSTFVRTGTAHPAFRSGGAACGIVNFNFLHPNQIKLEHEPAGSNPDPGALVVYPPAIQFDQYPATVLMNLNDYNSYDFIEWNPGAHGRCEHIISATHHQVLRGEVGESRVEHIQINEGTPYNGHQGWMLGPLVDISMAGPGWVNQIGINRGWLMQWTEPACRFRGGFYGSRVSNIWIDTDAAPSKSERPAIYFGQTTLGGGNTPVNWSIRDLVVSRGSAVDVALEFDFPDAPYGGGANDNWITADGCHGFWKAAKHVGGPHVLYSNCYFDRLILDSTGHPNGQKVNITGGSVGGAIESVGGSNWVKMANVGANQIGYGPAGKQTAGKLYIDDLDTRRTWTRRLAGGTVLPAGRTVLGHIFQRLHKDGQPQIFQVQTVDVFGWRQNDQVEISDLQSNYKTLCKTDYRVGAGGNPWLGYASCDMTGSQSYYSSMSAYDAMRPAVYQYPLTGSSRANHFTIYYNAQAGYTVPGGGIEVTIVYSMR